MEDPGLLVAALALVAYALLSRRLDRWWVSMPTAMLFLGVLLGPVGIGLVEITVGAELVKTVAELTLALMLFHDAVRIDLKALAVGRSIPLRLLGIGLPLMIVVGSVVGYAVFPELGLIGAALIATMLAPTDAALGAAVASDERLPVRIRQGLNVESGLNDGMSVPVFLVLLGLAADPGSAQRGALVIELLQQIGFGVLAGVVIGGGGGLLLRATEGRHLSAGFWRRIAIPAIAVSAFVAAAVAGGSGFIGAFVGGAVFGIVSQMRSEKENEFTEYLGSTFDAMSFFLLGAVLIPFVLELLDWRMVLYAALSLTVIRMGCVAIAMIQSGARWPTVAFMGWFGPRGLATLVFAVLVFDESIPNGDVIVSIAVTGIVLSVIAHGVTAPPAVRFYSEWWNRVTSEDADSLEQQDVQEHPLAIGHTGRAKRSHRVSA